MNKKWILITVVALLLIIISAYWIIPVFAFSKIINYESFTFEKIFNDPKMRADYGIFDFKSPLDYGYTSEDVSYVSFDNTALDGWYIHANQSSQKCIVLIHGRTSNRLKTMKYLALVDTFDLDSAYNVFIPDFRNSGKSAPSKTGMGYKFGEDLTATLAMLQEEYQQDTFFLYGFSMGAMAICNALGRTDLQSTLKEKDIYIEKIILDSPLANVKETLRDQSSYLPFANNFFDKIFQLYSEEIDNYGENMRISKLLPTNVPVLILQSKDDHTTPFFILSDELNEMNHYQNIVVKYFEGPNHVRIFQDDRTRVEYLETVGGFLKKHS